jgi:hypothetical protein
MFVGVAFVALLGAACQPPTAPRFTDATLAAGLGKFRHQTGAQGRFWFPETMGAGGAFVDYDGDGALDIALVQGSPWPDGGPPGPALRLYRNRGNGTFEETTVAAGLDAVHAYGFGVQAADYDNDGDADFYLTALHENLLLRNDGGRFVDVAREAGVAGPDTWSTAALFFDADRDGWLDLYVGHYVEWTPETDLFCAPDGKTKAYCAPHQYTGVPGIFYRNDGRGGFVEETESAGFVGSPGKTLGVAEWDFEGDGWPDLVVANDTQRNLFYRNRGDGTFEEIGLTSGVAFDENGVARAGMGIDIGEVGDDGAPWVVIGTFAREMIGVYRYESSGFFREIGPASGIGRPGFLTLNFGLFLADIDLDGYQDLFVANGHIYADVQAVKDPVGYRQPAQLFMNRGGTFQVVPAGEEDALDMPRLGRGAAYGDIDGDGDLDVLLTENGGPATLLRNDRPRGAFLRAVVIGTESNRDGLGAEVELYAGNRRQHRRIRTGSTYLSQSERVAAFGLGEASRVDSLIVRWPSGRVDRFADLAAGQTIEIREGTESRAFARDTEPRP